MLYRFGSNIIFNNELLIIWGLTYKYIRNNKQEVISISTLSILYIETITLKSINISNYFTLLQLGIST